MAEDTKAEDTKSSNEKVDAAVTSVTDQQSNSPATKKMIINHNMNAINTNRVYSEDVKKPAKP